MAPATATTANSSNLCCGWRCRRSPPWATRLRSWAGRSRPGRSRPRPGPSRQVILDLEATLQGGSRTFTLRVPEIDAEGHLIAKERVLNVQIPKGILRARHTAAGQGASTGSGARRPFTSRSIFNPPAVIARCPRPLPRSAGGAMGSRARRRRQSTTPGAWSDLKIPAGSRGHEIALERQRHSAATPADLYVVLPDVAAPASDEKAKAAYRALADALPFNPRRTSRSTIMRSVQDALTGEIIRGICVLSHRRIESFVRRGPCIHRRIGGRRRAQRDRGRGSSGASPAPRSGAPAGRCACSATSRSICRVSRWRWS